MHFSQKLGISFSLSQETLRCRQQKSGDKLLETTIESIHFKFQDAATNNDLENPKILKIGVLSKKRFLGQNMELFALLVDCEELAVPHAESRSIASKYQRIRTQNPD